MEMVWVILINAAVDPSMLPVLQKKNHCFIACIVSLLGGRKTQDEIVDLFPTQLQKGLEDKEGIPTKENDIKTIIIGLGIAKNVEPITSDHDERCVEPTCPEG